MLDNEKREEWDWTVKDGCANSSDVFLELCDSVAEIIANSAWTLINAHNGTNGTARVIMAQLAHVHDMIPKNLAFGPPFPRENNEQE